MKPWIKQGLIISKKDKHFITITSKLNIKMDSQKLSQIRKKKAVTNDINNNGTILNGIRDQKKVCKYFQYFFRKRRQKLAYKNYQPDE